MRGFRVPEMACLCVLGLLSIMGCSSGDDAEYRTYEAVSQTETGTAEEPAPTGDRAASGEQGATGEKDEPAGDDVAVAEASTADQAKPVEQPAPAMETAPGPAEPAATEGPSENPTLATTGDTGPVPSPSPEEGSPMPEPVVEPRTAAPGQRVVETGDAPAEPKAPEKQEGGVKLLVPEREFQTEGPEGALRVSFDDLDLLKVLNMDPVTADAPNLLPDWMRELDGKRIRLRGFMYPPPLEKDLPGFVLARDNQICCFGRNPKPYDILPVQMRSGVTTDYIQGRPFDVVGVFHLRPDIEDGDVYQLYEIDDAIVIDN